RFLVEQGCRMLAGNKDLRDDSEKLADAIQQSHFSLAEYLDALKDQGILGGEPTIGMRSRGMSPPFGDVLTPWAVLKALGPLLPHCKTVLEIGTGAGILTRHLAELALRKGWDVEFFATDILPDCVDDSIYNTRHLPNVKVILSDLYANIA